MMRQSRVLAVCLALSVLPAAAGLCADGIIPSGGDYLAVTGPCQLILGGSGSIRTSGESLVSATLPSSLVVRDGRSGDLPVTLGLISVSFSAGVLSYTYQDSGAIMTIVQSFRSTPLAVRCRLDITNRSAFQLWLCPELRLPLYHTATTLNYWDGFEKRSAFSGQYTNAGFGGVFPAAAVYGSSSGVLLGICADQIFSYIENSLDFPSAKVLSYGVKTIIDAGDTGSVEYVIAGFRPSYGYLDAVDVYYREFPAQFSPEEGIDPRVVGTTHAIGAHDIALGQEAGNADSSNSSYDPYRRTDGGITWWYAPFKKCGDYYCTQEEWSIPLEHESLVNPPFTWTTEQYQDIRRRTGERGSRRDLAYMFYITDWCEKDLAYRRYEDQILRKSDGSHYEIYPWVQSFTADLAMWWGGQFGEDTRRDLQLIANDLDIRGFAFDVADQCMLDANRLRARESNGNVLSGFPGRAYDADGVFCDESVARAVMMDYVHTLTGDGKKMATWPNLFNTYAYFVAFRSDSVLMELTNGELSYWHYPYHLKSRPLLGRKPRQFCGLASREDLDGLPPFTGWADATAETIRGWYRDLWADTAVICLQFGYYPDPHITWGYVDLTRATHIISRLIPLGWEPVPAFKVNTSDPDIVTSRYGRGINTYLCLGNRGEAVSNLQPIIDSEYLGGGCYAFSNMDGSRLVNVITPSQTRLPTLTAGRKGYQVYKALASLETTVPLNCAVTASEIDRSIWGVVTLLLNGIPPLPGSRRVTMNVRVPDGAAVSASGVLVNDRPIRFRRTADGVSFTPLLKRMNKVTVRWQDESFKADPRAWPFVKTVNGQDVPNCTIVIPDSAGEQDIATADTLQDYFQFYFSEVRGETVDIPVKRVSQTTAGDFYQVRIGLNGDGQPQASRGIVTLASEGRYLEIDAFDSDARRTLMHRMLGLLDQIYVYYGRIGKSPTWVYAWENGERVGLIPNDANTRAMREKAGLGLGGLLE